MKRKPFSFTAKTDEEDNMIREYINLDHRSAASLLRHALLIHINRNKRKLDKSAVKDKSSL